jgi:hypothetical protein
VAEEFCGGAVSYKYRIEDPRLGRFFSVDPLAPKYAMYSPYHFSSNQPIHSKELEGLESSNDLNPTTMTDEDVKYVDVVFAKLRSRNWCQLKFGLSTTTYLENWHNIRDAEDAMSALSFLGRDFGRRNVIRYLDGQGGYDIYSYFQMSLFNRFNEHLQVINNNALYTIRELTKGQAPGQYSFEVHEKSTQYQTGGDLMGSYTSGHGTSGMLVTGTIHCIIAEDGTVTGWGELYFTWFDKYNWDGDDALAWTEKNLGGIACDQQFDELKRLGARDFDARMYFSGKIHIDQKGLIFYDGKDSFDL